MINEGEHLNGVEPPGRKKISNGIFIKILKEKIKCSDYLIDYLKVLSDNKEILDVSGYSGSSTILIEDNKYDDSYVVKIQPKNSLFEEFIAYKFYNKYNLTSNALKYEDCGNYEIMIVKKINALTAGQYFDTFEEVSKFMGTELRRIHDMNFDCHNMTYEERFVFDNKYKRIYKEALESNEALIYMCQYLNDYDILKMKEFLRKNVDYIDGKTLLHGDFNPNNVFVKDGKLVGVVDFKDTGFADRNYDVFWSMWTTSLFSGLHYNREKLDKCEKIFLDSYGRDAIDEERIEFCKKLTCLYWKQHDEISRLDGSKYCKD